jgi:uncharacterized protein (DUF934 family)
MPIITDTGFAPDDDLAILCLDDLTDSTGQAALDLPLDADPDAVPRHFDRLTHIVIPFPGFADGRGFSLARRLRALGYRGRLRAVGHLIPDQYAFARFCGFDEVQISSEQADRQSESQWTIHTRPLPPFLRRRTGGWTQPAT